MTRKGSYGRFLDWLKDTFDTRFKQFLGIGGAFIFLALILEIINEITWYIDQTRITGLSEATFYSSVIGIAIIVLTITYFFGKWVLSYFGKTS